MFRVRAHRAVLVAVAAALATAAVAQQKQESGPGKDPGPKQNIEVRVVFTEHGGDQVESKLPYSIVLAAGRDRSSLRTGIQVPITSTAADGKTTVQYRDIGTNIDCRVVPGEDGRFELTLEVERSAVRPAPTRRAAGAEKGPGAAAEIDEASPRPPFITNLRQSLSIVIRDGQTVRAATVTDPVTGRITIIEATLSALK